MTNQYFVRAALFFSSLWGLSVADNESVVLQRLRQKFSDWKPEAVVDVGANVGKWTETALKSNYFDLDTPVFMVEATEKHRGSLTTVREAFPNVDFRIAVLTATDNETVQFFQGKNTGNSIFRENSIHYANDVPVERQSVSLDTAVAESHLKDKRVDYLKLDVQGAELLVLQGATKILQQVTFVQLEVSLTEYNAGGACSYDIDEYLRKRGFFLYDLGEQFRNFDAFGSTGIGQMDVLYMRPGAANVPEKLRNVQFCGASRATNATQTASAEQASVDILSLTSSMLEAPCLLWESNALEMQQQIILLLIVFVCGYVLGSWRALSSGGRKAFPRS